MIGFALAQSVDPITVAIGDTAPFKLGFWYSIFYLTLFGFIGGCTSGIYHLIAQGEGRNEKETQEEYLERQYRLYEERRNNLHLTVCGCKMWIFMKGIMGSCVSLGLIFIVVFLPILAGLTPAQQMGFFVGGGVIAGLFSERIMPMLERGLIERIDAKADRAVVQSQAATEQAKEASEAAGVAKSTADQASDEALEATTAAEEAVMKAEAALAETQVDAALGKNSLPSSWEQAEQRALNALQKNPENRTLSIKLGNLYFLKIRDAEKAEQVLKKMAEAVKHSEAENWSTDYGDAHYNLACFLASSPDEHEVKAEFRKFVPTPELTERALDLLAISFQFNPKNKKDAKVDDDLSALFSHDRFSKLTSE